MQFPIKFIQANKLTITSKTLTEEVKYGLKSHFAKRGDPHQYGVEWVTRKLTDRDYSELTAFLDGLDGKYNTFTLPCPKARYSVDTTSQVAVASTAGDNEVTVKGLTGVVVAGDYFKFSNHSKVYRVHTTSSEPVSGEAVVTITPRLQFDVGVNVDIEPAVFTLRLTTDNMASVYEAAKMHTPILISAVEDI